MYQIFQFKELFHEVNCQRREKDKLNNIIFHALYKQDIKNKKIFKQEVSTDINIYRINNCKRKMKLSQRAHFVTIKDGKQTFRYEIKKFN